MIVARFSTPTDLGTAMRTTQLKTGEYARKWYTVDAAGLSVGRLASLLARVLRGKHLPTYTPHTDTGDFVIVLNAEKAVFTGNKETDHVFYDYSGWYGGLKKTPAVELRKKHPDDIIRRVVKGMLPGGTLARNQLKKLKIYVGNEHPHAAQQPVPLDPSLWL